MIIVWMYRSEFLPDRTTNMESANGQACKLLIEVFFAIEPIFTKNHNRLANFSKIQWISGKFDGWLNTDSMSQKDGCKLSPNGAFFLTTSGTPKTGRKSVEIWNAKSDSSSFSVAIIFIDKDFHWFSHMVQPFGIPKTTVSLNNLRTSLTLEALEREIYRTSCATILKQTFFFVSEGRVSNKDRSVHVTFLNSFKTKDVLGNHCSLTCLTLIIRMTCYGGLE